MNDEDTDKSLLARFYGPRTMYKIRYYFVSSTSTFVCNYLESLSFHTDYASFIKVKTYEKSFENVCFCKKYNCCNNGRNVRARV